MFVFNNYSWLVLFCMFAVSSAAAFKALRLLDGSSEESNSTSREGYREGFEKLIGDWGTWLGVNRLMGFGPDCGPPSNCPPHACRFDPAIIHGYCCGCASPFDRVPITCPGNLQCPLYSEPLCSDYNYMMDCCC